jgi:tRNA pseudouridine-54 N-methylase
MHWLPPEGRIDLLVNAVTDAIHGLALGSEVRTDARMALRIKGTSSTDLAGTVKTGALALTQMEREAERSRRTGAVKRAAAATNRRWPLAHAPSSPLEP